MKRVLALAGLAVAAIANPAAAADDLAGRVAACAAIGQATQRLDCYDSLAAGKTAPPPAPVGGVLQEFAGSGAGTTRPFVVDGAWEVQWSLSGQILQIMVHDKGGRLVDIVANQQGDGSGSAYQPRGGSYYLAINALGSWRIRVVAVP